MKLDSWKPTLGEVPDKCKYDSSVFLNYFVSTP